MIRCQKILVILLGVFVCSPGRAQTQLRIPKHYLADTTKYEMTPNAAFSADGSLVAVQSTAPNGNACALVFETATGELIHHAESSVGTMMSFAPFDPNFYFVGNEKLICGGVRHGQLIELPAKPTKKPLPVRAICVSGFNAREYYVTYAGSLNASQLLFFVGKRELNIDRVSSELGQGESWVVCNLSADQSENLECQRVPSEVGRVGAVGAYLDASKINWAGARRKRSLVLLPMPSAEVGKTSFCRWQFEPDREGGKSNIQPFQVELHQGRLISKFAEEAEWTHPGVTQSICSDLQKATANYGSELLGVGANRTPVVLSSDLQAERYAWMGTEAMWRNSRQQRGFTSRFQEDKGIDLLDLTTERQTRIPTGKGYRCEVAAVSDDGTQFLTWTCRHRNVKARRGDQEPLWLLWNRDEL